MERCRCVIVQPDEIRVPCNGTQVPDSPFCPTCVGRHLDDPHVYTKGYLVEIDTSERK